MNFLPATIEGGVGEAADGRHQAAAGGRASGSAASTPGRKLIAGIRPEDFEDVGAGQRRDQRPRARRSTTKFDLVEAMGAEYYVHFGVRPTQLAVARRSTT